jgi:hypothetical protein
LSRKFKEKKHVLINKQLLWKFYLIYSYHHFVHSKIETYYVHIRAVNNTLANVTLDSLTHRPKYTGFPSRIQKPILLFHLFLILHTYSSSSSSIGTTTLSWVSDCSTVVEHSQQEGFTECRCQRHIKPPTWRRTRDLERSNFRHKMPPASEATRANLAAEGGTMGEKWPRSFAESGDFHVTFRFFYMP